MPATPRVAALGIGGAISIVFLIPIVAGVIATHYVGLKNDRGIVYSQLEQIYQELKSQGLLDDALPTRETCPDLWRTFPIDIVGFHGRYAVFDDNFPLHRLPRSVIAFAQAVRPGVEPTLDVASFDGEGVIGDVLGESKQIGIGLVFADGHIKIVKDSTPFSAIRPFLTRQTAVQSDRDRILKTYQLPL